MPVKYKTIHTTDIKFPVKVGDMLEHIVWVDGGHTSLYNAQRITYIQKNGIIRVECVNPHCKKRRCTFLHLSAAELKTVKIDNSITKSGRLGGITI